MDGVKKNKRKMLKPIKECGDISPDMSQFLTSLSRDRNMINKLRKKDKRIILGYGLR